jgi:hypothetical protein
MERGCRYGDVPFVGRLSDDALELVGILATAQHNSNGIGSRWEIAKKHSAGARETRSLPLRPLR